MKSMKDGPPHVEAKVGPVDAINGQLQLIWNREMPRVSNDFTEAVLILCRDISRVIRFNI